LHTVVDSNIVYSDSVDFQAEGILASDTIEVLELSFDTYTILSVSGNFLTLNQTMPTTLDDARFSVNKYSVVVSSEIDLAPNTVVSNLADQRKLKFRTVGDRHFEISENGANENVANVIGKRKRRRSNCYQNVRAKPQKDMRMNLFGEIIPCSKHIANTTYFR
jgi:hypothetical protein